MKPYVICHMVASLDGRINSRQWSRSPDGDRKAWSALYEEIHEALAGDAWLVGRVTMEEMADGEPHPAAGTGLAARPHHFATSAKSYAIALDAGGKLHFSRADMNGDHLVILLGRDVPDRHLAELASDGISYIVADGPGIDLPAMLHALGSELGIRRLLLEGGGGINGSFLAAGLVDEISLIIAPAVDGRSAGRAVFESGEDGLADKVQLSLTTCEKLKGGAVHLRYAVVRQEASSVMEPLPA
jgi:riboflavin biosynthesis pyrimidine reductase